MKEVPAVPLAFDVFHMTKCELASTTDARNRTISAKSRTMSTPSTGTPRNRRTLSSWNGTKAAVAYAPRPGRPPRYMTRTLDAAAPATKRINPD